MGALAAVDVVEEGARLAAAEGLEALSLRSLAGRLGVTPMALYRYVTDADALRRDVVSHLAASLPRPDLDRPAAEAYRVWAGATRAALASLPGFAHYLVTHWFEVPEVLDIVEGLLAVAARAGRRGFDAVAMSNAVFTFVLMRVELEAAITTSGVVHRRLRRAPATRPLLTAHSRFYEVCELDQHFGYGLDALLAGMGLTS